eukprot:7401343-Ditylum_brightwellii.AAC.1
MPTREVVTCAKFYNSSSNSKNGKTSENDNSCASSSSYYLRLQLGVLPIYQGPLKIGTKQSKISNYFGKKQGRKRKQGNSSKSEAIQKRWAKAIKIKCKRVSQKTS